MPTGEVSPVAMMLFDEADRADIESEQMRAIPYRAIVLIVGWQLPCARMPMPPTWKITLF